MAADTTRCGNLFFSHMEKQTKKTNDVSRDIRKKRPLSDSDSSESEDINVDMWPRYLVMHSTEENHTLLKLSAFAIHKAIIGIAGKNEEIKRLRNGDILIKVTKKQYCTNLLSVTRLVDVPVQVTPHRSLNSVKGIIRHFEVKLATEEEIVSELRPQGVIAARKIMVRRDGALVSTNACILTFGFPTLPSHINFGFQRLSVDVFIPNPLRCFKCQKFGHHLSNCNRPEVCARCGQAGHNDRGCEAPTRCTNCHGNHSAFDKSCPEWIREKAIQRVRTLENISFPEARKRVETLNQKPSYATVVQRKMVSISSQTEETSVINTFDRAVPAQGDASADVSVVLPKQTVRVVSTPSVSGRVPPRQVGGPRSPASGTAPLASRSTVAGKISNIRHTGASTNQSAKPGKLLVKKTGAAQSSQNKKKPKVVPLETSTTVKQKVDPTDVVEVHMNSEDELSDCRTSPEKGKTKLKR